MDYTLSNWAALSVYPDDGWLDIDNNEGENSLRGLCIGRRNWLFCGSDRGGRAAAIHFSLLASCKRHGHDPWVYLRDVLTRLPAMLPEASEEELLALLPHRLEAGLISPAPPTSRGRRSFPTCSAGRLRISPDNVGVRLNRIKKRLCESLGGTADGS